jgi:hypothetical protein
LAAPVVKMIQERLPPRSLVWTAGDLEKADIVLEFAKWIRPTGFDIGVVKDAKAFAGGIAVQESLVLIGHVQGRDDQAAKNLAKRLEDAKPKDATSWKVETPPADAADAERGWVTLQLRAEVDALRKLLGERKGE